MRAHVAALVCVLGSCATGVAFGQGSDQGQSQWLMWRAPAQCPTAEAVRTRVEHLLAPAGPGGQGLHATVSVQKQGQQFTLQLELSIAGQEVERTLNAPDCASVSDAAAWLIALAVDPTLPASAAELDADPVRPPEHPLSEAAAAQPPAPAPAPAQPTPAPAQPTPAPAQPTPAQPTPAPAPAQPTPAQPTPAQPTPAQPTPAPAPQPASAPDARAASNVRMTVPPGEPWRLRADAFSGVVAGGLAGAAGSLGVGAGAQHAGWIIDASLAWQLTRSRRLAAGLSSSFSSQTLAVRTCHTWGSALRVGPCVHADLLWVHGRALGTSQLRAATYLSARAGPSILGLRRIVDPVALWLEGRLSLPLTARPRFEVDGLGTVGQVASWVWALRAGVSVTLP